jgi:lipoprotein signal peptidase
MGDTMSVDTLTAPAASLEEERRDESGQRSIVLALLTMAVVLDQATKWWGWRHVPAIINAGGDWLVGSRVGEWYAGPVSGALLDLLDFGLVGIAVYVLIRHRRPTLVLISGALLIGGWGSNLLDRLAMHHVTAPGSGRGAVDFIQLGDQYYNVADFLIAIATPLLLLALGYQNWRATDRPVTPARNRWVGARAWVLTSAFCCMVLVAVGAASYGG